MSSCYIFEQIYLPQSSKITNHVDAAYIIHLKGNNARLQNIHKQLESFYICKTVYILHNEGMKCDKGIPNITPPLDLIDCYYTCFKDASEKNYENILILEDDFILADSIKTPTSTDKHMNTIMQYMKKYEQKPVSYRLGCLPLLLLPSSVDFQHYVGIMAGTHAVVYNKQFRIHLLKHTPQTTIKDWDVHCNFEADSFTYHTPLCYQLFPQTENSKYWGVGYHPFFNFLSSLAIILLSWVGLDKHYEPGFTVFYLFSKSIIALIIIVILFFICYLDGFHTKISKKQESFKISESKTQ